MECVCINEHSPGDTALVVPMLPSVFSCSQHHIHYYTSLFSCFEVHDSPSICRGLRSGRWTSGMCDRFRENRPDLNHFIAICRAVLFQHTSQLQMHLCRTSVIFLELWMHAPDSGATRHLSGPDFLLVSSAFAQGPCFSFCFFRMPCPLKIFLVCALCSLFRSTWESPFSCSLLWVLYNCIPTAYSTYLTHYSCESKSHAWNRCLERIGIQLLHFSNLTSIV